MPVTHSFFFWSKSLSLSFKHVFIFGKLLHLTGRPLSQSSLLFRRPSVTRWWKKSCPIFFTKLDKYFFRKEYLCSFCKNFCYPMWSNLVTLFRPISSHWGRPVALSVRLYQHSIYRFDFSCFTSHHFPQWIDYTKRERERERERGSKKRFDYEKGHFTCQQTRIERCKGRRKVVSIDELKARSDLHNLLS